MIIVVILIILLITSVTVTLILVSKDSNNVVKSIANITCIYNINDIKSETLLINNDYQNIANLSFYINNNKLNFHILINLKQLESIKLLLF